MSVSVHEAFSLDSQQDYLWDVDDFLGDSLDARWHIALGGGATGAVVDGVDGGIYRLGTPTASDNARLFWDDVRGLHVDKKVTMETRVKMTGGVTDTRRRFCQLRFDDNNRIFIEHDYDSSDIRLQCVNGGASTIVDSGINVDTDYHIYRIECFPAGEVHFYIDGVECSNSPITSNIPSDAADYLQPIVDIYTNADGGSGADEVMDVDYIQWRQDI